MDKLSIKVVGIGEGGARAIGKLIAAGVGKIPNVDFIAVGKDENIMLVSAAQKNIFLNRDATTIYKSISTALRDAKVVIIVAGIGGSAATQAIPRIVSYAKNANAATVAFVNKPFVLENAERKKNADYCLSSLREVDTKFIVPTEKFFLFRLNQSEVSLNEIFDVANDIFCQGVKIFLEMISKSDSHYKWGNATFGYGYGINALEAIRNAVKFPLFAEYEISHAKKIFIRLTGGNDTPAKNFIKGMIQPDTKLFWRVDDSHGEKIFASIILNRREV